MTIQIAELVEMKAVCVTTMNDRTCSSAVTLQTGRLVSTCTRSKMFYHTRDANNSMGRALRSWNSPGLSAHSQGETLRVGVKDGWSEGKAEGCELSSGSSSHRPHVSGQLFLTGTHRHLMGVFFLPAQLQVLMFPLGSWNSPGLSALFPNRDIRY